MDLSCFSGKPLGVIMKEKFLKEFEKLRTINIHGPVREMFVVSKIWASSGGELKVFNDEELEVLKDKIIKENSKEFNLPIKSSNHSSFQVQFLKFLNVAANIYAKQGWK